MLLMVKIFNLKSDEVEDVNESEVTDLCVKVDNEDDTLVHLPLGEQLVIYRSKVQQLELANRELRRDLNQTRGEQVNKTGVQSGLRIRINEQDNTILEMKNEKINLQLSNEQLENERAKLQEQLVTVNRQLEQIRVDVQHKDALIERLGIEIEGLKRERDEMRLVKQQVKRVSEALEIVQEKEVRTI